MTSVTSVSVRDLSHQSMSMTSVISVGVSGFNHQCQCQWPQSPVSVSDLSHKCQCQWPITSQRPGSVETGRHQDGLPLLQLRCCTAAVSERRARQDLERHVQSTTAVFAADALLSATSSKETKRRLQAQLGSDSNGAVYSLPVQK